MRQIVSNTACVLLALVLLGIWLSAAFDAPVQGVAAGLTSPFTRSWDGLTERILMGVSSIFGAGPQKRIRELEAEVKRLRIAALQRDDLRRQNQDLRAYYGLPRRSGWRPLIAEVIARDPVTWTRGFRISRGSNDGVHPGAVVLAGDYVIGRVTRVDPGSSSVTTVAAKGCRLGVRLEQSGATGILEGAGRDRWREAPACVIDFLPKDVAISAGELVWTSGLGGSVPGGLIVGRITAAKDTDGADMEVVEGAHVRCRMVPLADFDRIRFVAIYAAEPMPTGSDGGP